MAKTANKYELNIYKAQAIEDVARTLTYRLEDARNNIESYRTRIDEALKEDPDAYVGWDTAQLEQELQKEAIITELFKTLDKLM